MFYEHVSRKIHTSAIFAILKHRLRNEEVEIMKATAQKVNPEDFILSVLSPEDRLDAAFKLAGEAFKGSKLTIKDIDNAVKTVRKKVCEKKK